MSQTSELLNFQLLNFIENVHLGAKDSFGTKLKKTLGRIFFLKMLCQKSPSFFVASDVVPICHLVYVLEINNFRRDATIAI